MRFGRRGFERGVVIPHNARGLPRSRHSALDFQGGNPETKLAGTSTRKFPLNSRKRLLDIKRAHDPIKSAVTPLLLWRDGVVTPFRRTGGGRLFQTARDARFTPMLIVR